MTHTTDDVTAGTKAMYESSILLPELFDEPVWEKLDDPDRNDLCKAFAAGHAAMPDHSAELLEPLERLVTEVRGSFYIDREEMRHLIGNTNFAIIEDRIAVAKAAIAKARARKGEV